MTTRQYEFINGPETSELPTAGTPTLPADLLTLGYANAHYLRVSSNTYASPYAAVAGTSIPVSASYRFETKYVAGSGGVTMTANPPVADGAVNGHRLTLVGTSDTNYVRLMEGAKLDINGDMILYDRCRIELEYDSDADLWRECNRRG